MSEQEFQKKPENQATDAELPLKTEAGDNTRFSTQGQLPPVAAGAGVAEASASERAYGPLSQPAAQHMQENVGAVATLGSPVQRVYELYYRIKPWTDQEGCSVTIEVQRVANGEPVHAWLAVTYPAGHTRYFAPDGGGPFAAQPKIDHPEATTVTPIGAAMPNDSAIDVNELPATGAGGGAPKSGRRPGEADAAGNLRGGTAGVIAQNDIYLQGGSGAQTQQAEPEASAQTMSTRWRAEDKPVFVAYYKARPGKVPGPLIARFGSVDGAIKAMWSSSIGMPRPRDA